MSFDLLRAADPGIAEWRVLVTGGWLSGLVSGPLRGWLGVVAGGYREEGRLTALLSPSLWTGVSLGL